MCAHLLFVRWHCTKTTNQSCFTHSDIGGAWKICFYTFVTHSYDNKLFLTCFNMRFIWRGNVAIMPGYHHTQFLRGSEGALGGALLVSVCSLQGLLTFLSHKQTLLWGCSIHFWQKCAKKQKMSKVTPVDGILMVFVTTLHLTIYLFIYSLY